MTGDGRPAHRPVDDAVRELAGLRSPDPAARHAVEAIRLTRITLETFWPDAPIDHG